MNFIGLLIWNQKSNQKQHQLQRIHIIILKQS